MKVCDETDGIRFRYLKSVSSNVFFAFQLKSLTVCVMSNKLELRDMMVLGAA
jgi:hypothetical protein